MASKRIDIYFITIETNLAKTDHIVRKIYVVPMLWEAIWETTIIQIPNVIYGYSSIIFTLIKADVLFEGNVSEIRQWTARMFSANSQI